MVSLQFGGTFSVAGISTVTGTTLFTKQLNVSGVSTFHGNVNFLDGDRLRIGSSNDFELYHDGNHSYIAENGTGDLKIQATAGSIFLQKNNGEEMIVSLLMGPVELYFNDGKKIETTATGAVITGICTATIFKGDGDFVELDVDGHTNLDNVSIAGFTTITQDLDVDGHTNLDNVSIAGFTTFLKNINVLGSMTGQSVVLNAGSPTIFSERYRYR